MGELAEKTTELLCGHKFHTDCILESAWRGNISCPTCRALPIRNLNVSETLENLNESYAQQNRRDMQTFFQRGLRAGRKADCCMKQLKGLVKQYDAFIAKEKALSDKEKERKRVHTQFKKECQAAHKKILCSNRYKDAREKFNANTFNMTFNYHSTHRSSYRSTKKLARLKRKIAEAAGYQPLRAE